MVNEIILKTCITASKFINNIGMIIFNPTTEEHRKKYPGFRKFLEETKDKNVYPVMVPSCVGVCLFRHSDIYEMADAFEISYETAFCIMTGLIKKPTTWEECSAFENRLRENLDRYKHNKILYTYDSFKK